MDANGDSEFGTNGSCTQSARFPLYFELYAIRPYAISPTQPMATLKLPLPPTPQPNSGPKFVPEFECVIPSPWLFKIKLSLKMILPFHDYITKRYM